MESREAGIGPGKDVAAVEPFMITIEPGSTSATGRFTLRPLNDSLAEGTESLELTGETASGLQVHSVMLELTDDDRATVNLTLPHVDRLSEGGGVTAVTVQATLDVLRSTDSTVTVEVRGSGRTGVSDFEPVPSFEIAIPAGDRRGDATFQLTPENDDEAEEDETITISGRAGGLPVTSATLRLEDDDSETPSTAITLTLSVTRLAEILGPETFVTVTATLDGTALERDTVVRLPLLDSDDPPDLITLTLSETCVPEGDRLTVWVGAEITPSTRAQDTVVTLSVTGTGAKDAVRYEPIGDFELTIPKGRTVYEASFRLVTEWNEEPGKDETLTVSGTTEVAGIRVKPVKLVIVERDGARGTPAKASVWTDEAGYEEGQAVRLYRDLDPGPAGGNRGPAGRADRGGGDAGSAGRADLRRPCQRVRAGLLGRTDPARQNAGAGHREFSRGPP